MVLHTYLIDGSNEALHCRIVLGRWEEVVERWSGDDTRHYTLNMVSGLC